MSAADDLYREVVLEHHRNPLGRQPLDRVDAQARGKNPNCGDEVLVQLQQEGETIVAVCADARGCAISTASASILAGLVQGVGRDRALSLVRLFRQLLSDRRESDVETSNAELGDLAALVGVRKFPLRVKCAMLPWVALEQALEHPGQVAPGAVSTEGTSSH
jgi:nitrogen fixation NifU-like protein